jgi:hypothetical protein
MNIRGPFPQQAGWVLKSTRYPKYLSSCLRDLSNCYGALLPNLMTFGLMWPIKGGRKARWRIGTPTEPLSRANQPLPVPEPALRG